MQNEEFRKLLRAYPAKAIKILYDKYYYSLLAIARRHVNSAGIAEDIVQETFVYVWENHVKLGEYNKRPIQYFLIRVVRYKAVSEFRRIVQSNNARVKYAVETKDEAKIQPSEAQIIGNEGSDRIRQVIESFPRRERECLTMKFYGEMNNEQIALALSVSKKAVERSITSGNHRLRKWWAENS